METNQRDDGGFTLIELLIVIVILGVLSTVVVFAVRGIADRGEESTCAADRKVLEIAIESAIAADPTGELDPTSVTEAELVRLQFLREESSNWNIEAGTGEIVPQDPRCEGSETTTAPEATTTVP